MAVLKGFFNKKNYHYKDASVTIYTHYYNMKRVYMRQCTICNKKKNNGSFYLLKNACKECLNFKRRSQYKNSICRYCKVEYRPGVEGRYKFCSEMCRFMIKVYKDKSGCWLWQAGIHKDGYGDFVPAGGRSGLSHRSSYRIFKGPIPEGMLVLHSCHVTPCVNPDHLRLGTHADNARDKVEAKRTNPRCGVRNHLSKLTEDKVREIRKMHEEGSSFISISRLFDVGSCQIKNIVKRLSWKHVI